MAFVLSGLLNFLERRFWGLSVDPCQSATTSRRLTARVEEGKKAGKPIAELQKTITVASLKSLQANGYSKYLADNLYKFFPNFGPAEGVNTNIDAIYKNLERV